MFPARYPLTVFSKVRLYGSGLTVKENLTHSTNQRPEEATEEGLPFSATPPPSRHPCDQTPQALEVRPEVDLRAAPAWSIPRVPVVGPQVMAQAKVVKQSSSQASTHAI